MKTFKHIDGEYKPNWYANALFTNVSFACLAFFLMELSFGKPLLDFPYGLFASIFLAVAFFHLASKYQFLTQLNEFFGLGQKDFIFAKEVGIFLDGNNALPAQFRAWEQISEVVLTKKLNIVNAHGKLKCRNVAIIFLSGQHEYGDCEGKKRNAGVSKSATGRDYISTDFPDGDWRKFETALRKFAPRNLKIKVCSGSSFDHNTRDDYFIEA